jgi:uncharacterized protein DUF6632
MTIASHERLESAEQRKLRALQIFLRVYGGVSLALFSALMLGFMVQFRPLDQGQPLHWVIWDRVNDHVGPMLFAIYIVWSVFLIRAASDPIKYRTFLDFTMWANLAHGALMIPQALGDPQYYSKFLTDIPWIWHCPPRSLSCGQAQLCSRGKMTLASAVATGERWRWTMSSPLLPAPVL